jgi:hypothetical protein
MAYSSNPGPASRGGGGGEDYYSDAPAKTEAPKGDEGKSDEGAMETTIPKSLLMGKDFKVGEEVVFEITAMHGEEVSIKYATGDKGSDEEAPEGGEPAAAPKGDSEMSSMMY